MVFGALDLACLLEPVPWPEAEVFAFDLIPPFHEEVRKPSADTCGGSLERLFTFGTERLCTAAVATEVDA